MQRQNELDDEKTKKERENARQVAKDAEESLQRLNDMKLKGNQAIFDQKREHAAILDADKRKRASDAQREEQDPKRQKVSSSQQGAKLITVGEVARESTKLFKDINQDEHAGIIKDAGAYCVAAYRAAKGCDPPQVTRGVFKVNGYKPGEERAKFITPAIVSAVNEHNARAKGLKPISECFAKAT